MNLNRWNIFDIFTVMLFTGLIFRCRQSVDNLGWTILFSLIILSAILFIIKKPISMISWITIVIGILGILMSTPALIESGIEYFNGSPEGGISVGITLYPAMYFMTTILFSLMQILRTVK